MPENQVLVLLMLMMLAKKPLRCPCAFPGTTTIVHHCYSDHPQYSYYFYILLLYTVQYFLPLFLFFWLSLAVSCEDSRAGPRYYALCVYPPHSSLAPVVSGAL